jgi:hypothetical protein
LPVDCSWFFVFGSTGATNFDSLIPFKHYQPYMCTPSVLYCIHVSGSMCFDLLCLNIPSPCLSYQVFWNLTLQNC